MTAEAVEVKIRLGSIKINAYRLKDGSYAAVSLVRLYYTDVYRYGDSWYWLGHGGTPDLTNCKFWGRRGDVSLAFQGNKLCHLYVDPTDPEGALYVPIPSDLRSAIEFCTLGKLFSASAMAMLSKFLDQSCSLNRALRNRSIDSTGLLKDTAQRLPKVEDSTTDVKNNKPSSTPKQPRIEKPSSTSNKPRIGIPIGYDGFIYLVKLDAHLKLGFTRNINKRLKSFETTSVRVELIESVYGTMQDEKNLHSILGSKVRELYDFKDEQRIIRAMMSLPRISRISMVVR
jgi:hypothetical protein